MGLTSQLHAKNVYLMLLAMVSLKLIADLLNRF